MKRKILGVLAVMVIAIVAYIILPYVHVYSLYDAVQAGDAERAAKRIDFASFRESLKQELNDVLMQEAIAGTEKEDDSFAGLAMVFMPNLVEAMIDVCVTPAGLAALMEGKPIDPAAVGKGQASPSAGTDNGLALRDIDYAFFTNPTTFLVDVKGVKLRFRLRDWGWKLTEIDLPEDMTGRPAR